MESTIELLEIKGVQTPNFAEPKGDAYRKAMAEVRQKVQEKQQIKANSTGQIKKLQGEINALKAKKLMALDKFEELEIMSALKAKQAELEDTDDYSALNIDDFSKRLIANPSIEKLKEEAEKEHTAILRAVREYEAALQNHYSQAMKEINRFTAGLESDSTFRQASVIYSGYKNSWQLTQHNRI